MSETHIHIHLNGEAASTAAPSPTKSPKKKTQKTASPTKKPRAVSPYHKTVGKEMKRLKKAHPRMSPSSRMKKAHKAAKKKHKR